jgi:endogenous inhibitor of DNA gyrase (YacG/DUF329 family)
VSILKPIPVIPEATKRLCPICGKASYSRDGIHPQCSLNQADAARNAMLREKRKLEPKREKPKQPSFSKTCPKCGVHVHVRLQGCACGQVFAGVRR